MKFLKKLLPIMVAVAFISSCLSMGPVEQKGVEHELTILHTNDHHGHPLSFYDYPASGQGGLPAQATYAKNIEANNENVLIISAGDFNTGRPESNFFKSEPDILGFNYIGYDVMTMGNHEFDNNWDLMQEQIAMSDFPWLAANVKKDGEYLDNVQPYVIQEFDGFKVAILGLLDSRTVETGNPENISGIDFLDEVEVANELVPMLQEKADIVIAVVHMGLYDNDNEGSRRLAANVPGLALIIDGHSHTMMDAPLYVNETPIVQARQWGLYVGNGTLKFMDGVVTSFDWQLDPINVQYKDKDADGNSIYKYVTEEIEEDAELLAMLTPYGEKVDAVLNEVIGNATDVFLNDDSRVKETALGDIVTDSQEWFLEKMGMDIDFAFQNGGGIRATLAAGEIKKSTVYEVLPFDNSIAKVTLTGAQVVELFNTAVTKIGSGAMPQVSKSVAVTFNVEAGTVESLLINGKAVVADQLYNIAVNSYVAAGGDGYSIFTSGTDYYDSSLMQRDAFIDYVVELGGDITPATDGRIVLK